MGSPKQIAAAGIFKNEAPYIVEWIAWHRAIGFDKFIIADNESSDATKRILLGLEKLGLVEYLAFPSLNLKSPQLAAYEYILRNWNDRFEWLAFIDADEFIVPTTPLADFPRRLRSVPDDVGAVLLNWACFGSSGNDRFENRPVVERFENRSHADTASNVNLHYKSVVRPKAVFPGIPNPHHFPLRQGFRHARLDGVTPEVTRPHGGLTNEVDWSEWRINHYRTKSWSEYYRRKMPIGRSDRPDLTRTFAYFFQNDLNDILDPLPTELRSRLLVEIKKITGLLYEVDPGLKEVIEGYRIADAPPRKFFYWSRAENADVKVVKAWRHRPIARIVSGIRVLLWEKLPRL